ncbi:MAG: D-alanyl-D-alanine carboxypeptidase family protein [Candidatus Saccharibacteria bacterium]|nr:D-alanyl-D-alanine carboxypeptidase family protein [Candidatus Saccharibacteria bacterium]MCY4088607.1 D-alanyl-D-alanine carboxypeptidase family protein [Candidatus Saccharibacteria bacterium]
MSEDLLLKSHFSGEQFDQSFDRAQLPNLESAINDNRDLSLTGDLELDNKIRVWAEARGYVRRNFVADESLLAEDEDGCKYQPLVAQAFHALQAEAWSEGLEMKIFEGFRDHLYQRQIFMRPFVEENVEMNESNLKGRLRWVAPPGYSKHHTGYVIDITHLQDGQRFKDSSFINTPSFAWLSADNYAKVKKFGFIPSYPADLTNCGPNPEPWEYVYVGRQTLISML